MELGSRILCLLFRFMTIGDSHFSQKMSSKVQKRGRLPLNLQWLAKDQTSRLAIVLAVWLTLSPQTWVIGSGVHACAEFLLVSWSPSNEWRCLYLAKIFRLPHLLILDTPSLFSFWQFFVYCTNHHTTNKQVSQYKLTVAWDTSTNPTTR